MRTMIVFSLVLFAIGCFSLDGEALDVKPAKPKDKGTDSAILGSLHQSFAKGPDEAVLKLVKGHQTLIHDRDESDCTALHYAARYGRVETAKWLIEQKADVNTVSYNRFTPMHMVSDAALARILIKAGANLKAKDSWGKTPLQSAAHRPGAGNLTALSNAVISKQYEIAEILCKAGADCNLSAGKFYPRLLDYATKHSEPRMIELLKKYGGKSSDKD